MHGDMGRIGHQIALFVKMAQEIQPFLDVHGPRGICEGRAHLVGHGHEQVAHHFQQDRVGLGPGSATAGKLLGPLEDEISHRVERGCPARFHNIGASGFGNDGRTGDAAA